MLGRPGGLLDPPLTPSTEIGTEDDLRLSDGVELRVSS